MPKSADGNYRRQKYKMNNSNSNNLRHISPLLHLTQSFSMIGHISGLFYRSLSFHHIFYYTYSIHLSLFFCFFCAHSFYLFSYLKGKERAIILHKYEKMKNVCLLHQQQSNGKTKEKRASLRYEYEYLACGEHTHTNTIIIIIIQHKPNY